MSIQTRRTFVRSIALAATLIAVVSIAACQKTGENTYEVEKPVIGTQTDTVRMPDIDLTTQKETVTVPTVGTKKTTVNVPKVEVKRPPPE